MPQRPQGSGANSAGQAALTLSEDGRWRLLMRIAGLAGADDLPAALARYESSCRPRAELALKLSRRVDHSAQLTNPVGRRMRNLLVRWTPDRAQRRQLAPLVHHQLH